MVKFEKTKELVAELEEHKGDRHVYAKLGDWCYQVGDIYVDGEGDLIMELIEE